MRLFSRRGRLSPGEIFPAGRAQYRVSHVVLRSGTKVRVAETGEPTAPPVLLLPGWGSSIFVWRHNLEALAEAGFRAIAVDLKGAGLSDKPLGETEYSTPALLSHVEEILDALALERPVIVGHSLGASLAFRFARQHPDRARAVVLVSPVGHAGVPLLRLYKLLTPRALRRLLPRLSARIATRIGLIRAYGKLRRFSEREIEEYCAPWQFREFAIAQRDLLHGFDWNEPVQGPLDVPLLLIYGSRDHLVGGAAIAPFRRAIADIEVVEIPDAGHIVSEEAPQAFNSALIRFLRRV